MSSDNYFVMRQDLRGEKFVVTMEFASDEGPRPLRKKPDGTYEGGCTRVFDTYNEAFTYAHDEYSEYGVDDLTGMGRLERAEFEIQAWQRYNAYLAQANEQDIEENERLLEEVSALREQLRRAERATDPYTFLRLTNAEANLLRRALSQYVVSSEPGDERDAAVALGWQVVAAHDAQFTKPWGNLNE